MHFAYTASGNSQDPKSSTVTVMNSDTCSMSITTSASLKLRAQSFQNWSKRERGTTNRVEVGLFGFERGPTTTEDQRVDPIQQHISQAIKIDNEKFLKYRDMKYADDGDGPGLLSSCRNAGLLGKSPR